MVPGGARRLQNDCDPTASGLVGSIPMHSRQGGGRALCRALLGLVALALLPIAASAQRIDSARVTPRAPAADTAAHVVAGPPISPRRAFLYSFILPGYGQSILGRPTAGAIFVLAESVGLAMLRESSADLREARRFRSDSLVVIGTDAAGKPVTQASPWTQTLIDVRRSHVEDWAAFLVANHLFAAADAYVAAHLWDLPAQVSLRSTEQGTVVAARLRW